MISPAQLTKRVEDLEEKTPDSEPQVLVCDACDYDTLRALHPKTLFIVDNIPWKGTAPISTYIHAK
jgi:hypothetical protein